jgi:spermidine synthase
MKKFLSFFWPVTKRVQSQYNGVLEVTWSNARKILDSKNANYSYGSLQRILERSLTGVDLSIVKSVLLLGMGGGSIISSLRKKFAYRDAITAVEIDPVVIEVAKDEFGIFPGNGLTIIQNDALLFVEKTNERFDLIIVDLFIDDKVPNQFYSAEFCRNITRICSAGGQIIFNVGLNTQLKGSQLQLTEYFQQAGFKAEIMENLDGMNLILIARKLQ